MSPCQCTHEKAGGGPEDRVHDGLGRQVDLAHAVLGCRSPGHRGAERGGELLGPEAHAEHGPARPDRLAQESPLVGKPPEVIVHAHRAAHHHEPRDVRHRSRRWNRFATIDAHDGQVGTGVADGERDGTRAFERDVLDHQPGIARAHGVSGDRVTRKSSAEEPSGSPACSPSPRCRGSAS